MALQTPLYLIAALGRNRVIGVTGDLPLLATAILAPLEVPILDQQVRIEEFPVDRVYDAWVDLVCRITRPAG